MAFSIKKRFLFSYDPDVSFMDVNTLNPAVISYGGALHMLFRCCGKLNETGRKALCPIALGYACSDDNGKTWRIDKKRPALSPACKTMPEDLTVTLPDGKRAVNYANGSIEDPRLHCIDGTYYLTVACRFLPMGPIWETKRIDDLIPDWAYAPDCPFVRAAENLTATVLYRVDMDALAAHDYDNAFTYITNLSDPAFGENRDVVFFSERMKVGGKTCYVMLDRPSEPHLRLHCVETRPSITVAAAERFEDLEGNRADCRLFAVPEEDWQAEKIGASTPPLRLDNGLWLVPFHGKQNEKIGYTQNFLLVKERENDLPVIVYRGRDRLITVTEDWEKPGGQLGTPCIFFTGLVRNGDELLFTYGAADEKVGLARLSLSELLDHIRADDAGWRCPKLI